MFGIATSTLDVCLRWATIIGPIIGHDFETAARRRLKRPHGNPRKGCGQLVELLALPAVVGMIVALAALNLDAEEDAGNFGGGFFGATVLSQLNGGCAVFANVAGGRDELGSDFVPGLVLVELFRQQNHQRIRDNRCSLLE